ncbi:tetratricopeptide repeat protein [Singulisphaera rosea]
MRPITFSHHAPGSDRRHFVTEAEVRFLLERLPTRLWDRLVRVHFNDHSRGRRLLGYVTWGRNEIALCGLPPRVSLSSSLGRSRSPARFGAVRGCQWPTLAVRRFMLYDVFLHELGHLQIVDKYAKSKRRKFAHETRAQDFAEYWCRELWSRPSGHPDPVHGPPTPEEINTLRCDWVASNGGYKTGLLRENAKRHEDAVLLFTKAVERYPDHAFALERLGVLTYSGVGTAPSNASALERLSRAIRLDPSLFDAHVFLGLALSREGRQAEARAAFERGIVLDRYSPLVLTFYADALADWGEFAEAEALFLKAMRQDPSHPLPVRDYGRSLLRNHNPEADDNLERAIELFERAVALDPRDAESHYRLGNALACLEGEELRAMDHLRTALRLKANHRKAAEMLAELEADQGRESLAP